MLCPDRCPPTFRERPRLLEGVTACPARRDDNRIAQLREREKVASVQGELDDLAILDDVADFGASRFEQRRRPLSTVTCSAQPTDGERDSMVTRPVPMARSIVCV
jgi:hypothetical protein